MSYLFASDTALEFGQLEGQEVENRAAAGQGLGYPLHEQEILGTRQYESAGGGIPIHQGLYIGK